MKQMMITTENNTNELMATYRDAIYCFENNDYIGAQKLLNDVANSLLDVAVSKRGMERARAYDLANVIYAMAKVIAPSKERRN